MTFRALWLVTVVATASAAAAAQEPAPRFIVGACAHLAQNIPYPAANLALARAAGIASIRDEVYWSAVEPERGKLAMPAAYDAYVDTAAADGIAPLLILDYGNALYDHGDKPRSDEAIAAFTRYAVFVAQHFRGKVHRYEIWNEWSNNLGNTTPGSIDDYARLLKAVYPALKQVDPGITVLADGIVIALGSDSDARKLRALGLLRYADAISIHPYSGAPEASIDELRQIETGLRAANGGTPVPIDATEIGWPSFTRGVSLSRQAAYAARLLLLARSLPFVGGVWWYDFRNDGQDAKSDYPNYGLVWANLTPKPAYDAFAATAAALADARFVDRVPSPNENDKDWILRFRTAQGEDVWAFWTTDEGTLAQFGLTTAAEAPPAVTSAEAGHRAAQLPWLADPHVIGWHIEVTAGATPVLLRGDLSKVSLLHVADIPFPSDRR